MTSISEISHDVIELGKTPPSLEADLGKKSNETEDSLENRSLKGDFMKATQQATGATAKDLVSPHYPPLTSIPTPTSISTSISRRLSPESENGNIVFIREISKQGREIGSLRNVNQQLSEVLQEERAKVKALGQQLGSMKRSSEEAQETIAGQKSACNILSKNLADSDKALQTAQQELSKLSNKGRWKQRLSDPDGPIEDRLKAEEHKRIQAEEELGVASDRIKNLETQLEAKTAAGAKAHRELSSMRTNLSRQLDSLRDFLPKFQTLTGSFQTDFNTATMEWQAQARAIQALTSDVRGESGDGLGGAGSAATSDMTDVLNPRAGTRSIRRLLSDGPGFRGRHSRLVAPVDSSSPLTSLSEVPTAVTRVPREESDAPPRRPELAERSSVETICRRGFVKTPLFTNPHDDQIELFERCNVAVGPVFNFPYINAAAYAIGDDSVRQMLDEIDAIVRSGGDITAENIRRAHFEVTIYKQPHNWAHKIARINQGTDLLVELCEKRPERRDLLEVAAEMNQRKRRNRNHWDPSDETEKLTYALLEQDRVAALKRNFGEVGAEGEGDIADAIGQGKGKRPRKAKTYRE